MSRLQQRGQPILTLTSYGDPLSAGSSYGLLGQGLRRLCGVLDGEDPARSRGRLQQRLSRHLPAADAPAVCEFLGELCGIRFPDEESVKLRAARQDPRLMSDQLRQALIDLVQAE